jgi:transposase-like protein
MLDAESTTYEGVSSDKRLSNYDDNSSKNSRRTKCGTMLIPRKVEKREYTNPLEWNLLFPLRTDCLTVTLTTQKGPYLKNKVLTCWTGIVRLTAEEVIGLFMGHNPLMRLSVSRYHRHRFPAEIISHCVWLYFRFALSFRDVEEMLAMRGVSLSYETVREWCLKFGQTYANGLRRRSPRPGDQWHLDEVFLKISGRIHYLWRAVDQDGDVLDILVQSRRDQKAAKKFFRKLLKGLRYVPRVIVTDKLKSYSAAKAAVMPSIEHRQDRGAEQPR